MFDRVLKLPKNHSFFLFGARATGKTTLIKKSFPLEQSRVFDLLEPDTEDMLGKNPASLEAIVRALSRDIKYIIIDEVQKVPKLLDLVHRLIENTDKIFILSGSSARKLKYGGANLLAGRAFVYNLFPCTSYELGAEFSLDEALKWGMLPKIYSYSSDHMKGQFLKSYAQTYLKEEIWSEHIVRKLDPFRKFLEVAAQSNGKIINFSNIARDVGVDPKTIISYYNILEDTLIGFFLMPFANSFRKRLQKSPKFYFFDIGVTHALANRLSLPIIKKTSFYGEVFEHFVILECLKNAAYFYPDYRFSYLQTKDDAQIDLIVDRPGLPFLFIEIKSSNEVRQKDLSNLGRLAKDYKNCEAICLSQIKETMIYDNITIMPWQDGVKKYFIDPNLG